MEFCCKYNEKVSVFEMNTGKAIIRHEIKKMSDRSHYMFGNIPLTEVRFLISLDQL